MIRAAAIESAIQAELTRQGPCQLQALLDRLPQFSWSEMFAVIDQLSREGRLVLRHTDRFDYQVSVGLTREVSVNLTRPILEQPAEESDPEKKTVPGRADQGSPVYEEQVSA